MKKFLKQNVLTIAIMLVFLIGLAVMIYPAVSDYFIKRSQSRVVASYRQVVERMDPREIERMFTEAQEYNERLLLKPNRFEFTEEDYEEYYTMLSVDTDGVAVIGSLEIGLINVDLPIYHGTSESVLQVAIGHLEGSTLPIGGPQTHAVITGHRGLPSALLLTELDRMGIGDTFVLHVLNETMTYMVDQILVVEPTDFSSLIVDPEMDYVTLLTCTPYGINSHRLLVRGHRIENEEAATIVRTVILSEARMVRRQLALFVIFIPALIILSTVKIILNMHNRKKDK